MGLVKSAEAVYKAGNGYQVPSFPDDREIRVCYTSLFNPCTQSSFTWKLDEEDEGFCA